MTWAHIDDQSTFHAKVLAAGNAAWGACVRMIAWSTAHLTDGRIPMHVATIIADCNELSALERAGLVHCSETEVQIHDFLDWNRSAKDVKRDRAAKQRAGKRGGIRSGEARKQNPSRRFDSSEAGAQAPAEAPASRLLQEPLNPSPLRSESSPIPKEEIEEPAREARSSPPPEGGASAPKPKRTKAPKTPELPIPEDWAPPESFWVWAEKKRYAREDCERCIESLSLWARSKNVRRADWTAALQGWVNREAADGKVSLAPLKQPSHGGSLPLGEPMPVSEVSEMLLAGLARLEGSQEAGTAIDFSGLGEGRET